MPNPAAIAFVSLGMIWGSNFVFMKWASETIAPGQITFLRVLFGFLPILVYAAVRRVLDRRHLRHLHHFVVMSLLATSIYYFAFAAGTSVLASGIAGALSGAIPLFSFVCAAVLLKGERITPLRTIGVLTAALTTYQIGIALLMLAAVTDYQGITGIGEDRRALIGMVVGLGLLGTGVAYILYYFIVERLGAITASSATYIPPVVALIIGWALVGDRSISST